MWRLPLLILIGLVAATACSDDENSDRPPASVEESDEGGTVGVAGTEDGATPETTPEAFVGAFYTFDPASLSALPWANVDSETEFLEYQSWAKGADYELVEWSCTLEDEPLGNGDTVTVCPVTVDDDLGRPLGYQATDTFRIATNEAGEITLVISSGDDPPVFGAMMSWLEAQQPGLFAEGGPCSTGLFRDEACAVAVTQGAADYAQTDEYEAP
jgi:hypothetical protein